MVQSMAIRIQVSVVLSVEIRWSIAAQYRRGDAVK
jgi:hypothetical protein